NKRLLTLSSTSKLYNITKSIIGIDQRGQRSSFTKRLHITGYLNFPYFRLLNIHLISNKLNKKNSKYNCCDFQSKIKIFKMKNRSFKCQNTEIHNSILKSNQAYRQVTN